VAIRHPRRVRLALLGVGLALTGTAIIPSLASATPAPAPADTVTTVTAKLHQLAQQNELLAEQANLATADVAAKQDALAAARTAAAAAAATYAEQREELRHMLASQYEGSSFSHTGALLNSSSGASYIDQVNQLNMLAMHRADVLAAVTTAKKTADTAQATADKLLTAANAKSALLKKQQSDLAGEQVKYQSLLSTLTAAERAAYTSYDAPAPAQIAALTATPVHAGTAAAQAAVDFAMAQVGKPYVYGSGGPNSYDCSGLTMASWRAGGISLPHNAAAQYGYGTHVAQADLQPGDLIFFYHPISHVTIYIGNGLMVSAPTEGEPVKIATVAGSQRDYVGATRLT
jgi:cell wall-associated NlpC family hydrolase